MGYSVSVSVRSHRFKSEMYDFLKRLYRPWSEIVAALAEEDDEDYEILDFFNGPFLDGELASARGKCLIGWDYHPTTGPEREYYYALVRWIAIQVGKRRRRFRGEDLTLDRPVPYYVYDGIEAMPILLTGEWPRLPKELEPYGFDHLGMPLSNRVLRELAWFCIPEGAFERVAASHHGQGGDVIKEALIQEGLEGAEALLHLIRSQIGRLDVLWQDQQRANP